VITCPLDIYTLPDVIADIVNGVMNADGLMVIVSGKIDHAKLRRFL
jgi:hypothetical protein